MYNLQKLKESKSFVLKENSTIIISSAECKCSVCFTFLNKKPEYKICKSTRKSVVEDFCKRSGFPLNARKQLRCLAWDFITHNSIYVLNYNSKNGIGVCIEEYKGSCDDARLDINQVKVPNWQKLLENDSKQSENE